MGGSGGGGFFSGDEDPRELRKKVRDADEKAKDEAVETQVSGIIDSILANVNKRDTDAINRHLDTIKRALEADIEGSLDLAFGGSISKHTYVDGLSDVDLLVVISRSDLNDKGPKEVQKYIAERLRERFPESDVRIGALAVTIKFGDAEIQLLPALKHGTGLRIASSDGASWSGIVRPDRFARELTKINQRLNGKVVPAIKIAKSIVEDLPKQQRLSGYHLESLAVKALEGYTGPGTTKAVLTHLFTNGHPYILQPIADSTGQSTHVDAYMGSARSDRRRIAAEAFGRIGRRMQNADAAKSVDQWKSIL